ncbi:hypothetical protein [Microvirga pudoricolor]|uniref:hypothetical protein n=1 Tax=Microvirga pudoricolor TaxID=2778729 RepID=UPI00194E774A|nr:hypothetical protein [Microvirga pudoricolor]MBM6594618.1 hypothetical protein [Microvirga pudoricolor]
MRRDACKNLPPEKRVLGPILGAITASGLWFMPAQAKIAPSPETCRATLKAFMANDVDAAVTPLDPDPPEAENARTMAARLTDAIQGYFKDKSPRLERTLPDIDVEGHATAVQIWSFGDREVYFVGCLMRQESGNTGIHFQANPSMDEVVKKLKASLTANKS